MSGKTVEMNEKHMLELSRKHNAAARAFVIRLPLLIHFCVLARSWDMRFGGAFLFMARINVDSKFFTDARFKLLVQEVGEHRFFVLGRILELWHYCYEHLTTLVDPKMIDAVCERKGFANELVSCELGEMQDGKVHVRGVRKRIENLLKASEDGKKSAAIRRQKYGTAQPDRWKTEGNPKVPSEDLLRSSEPHTHTHTHTHTQRKKNMPSADALGPDLVDLGKRWLAFALAQTPTGAENANWTEVHFAVEIGKIMKNLSITITQANELFDFIQGDHDFWAKNAISPSGLLKKSKNGLRKVENIMNAMRRNPVQKVRSAGTNVVQIKPLVGGYE
jgi:hypothetical protein